MIIVSNRLPVTAPVEGGGGAAGSPKPSPPAAIRQVVDSARAASHLVILDYDGSAAWQRVEVESSRWREPALEILREFTEETMVVEVRPHGVDKGRVARLVLERAPPASVALAIGDDRTDEDLFAALPQGSIAVHVGAGESCAGVRVDGVEAARRLLADIAAA
jgi:trehalose-6-phosphatase